MGGGPARSASAPRPRAASGLLRERSPLQVRSAALWSGSAFTALIGKLSQRTGWKDWVWGESTGLAFFPLGCYLKLTKTRGGKTQTHPVL